MVLMTDIPEEIKQAEQLQKFSDEDKQLIWDIANDLCANYLMAGGDDPIMLALSRIKIDDTLYNELIATAHDGDLYNKFFKIPDLYVFKHLIIILDQYDQTKGSREWKAYRNLIVYLMNKMVSDPWWYSRIGHLNRFMGSHMRDESYWPIAFNLKFTPNEWFNTHDMNDVNTKETNDNSKSIADVYGWDDD